MLRCAYRMAVLAVLAGCGQRHDAPARAPKAADQPAAPLPSPAAAAPLATGRFQIVTGTRDTSGTYLLDTMTGRVWHLVQKREIEGAPYVWEHMDRLDSNADDYVFRAEHQRTGR